MKISEILWLAANKYLISGDPREESDFKSVYSCIAITCASHHEVNPFEAEQAKGFYESLAVLDRDNFSFSLHAENLLPIGEYGYLSCSQYRERQQIRYCWLMLASQIAEEEGL